MNLHEAKRPVLILGAGIHQARAKKGALELIELLQIPVALTWGAADLLPESSPLRIGTFGTHGTRAANFAVQNADFILSVGCRLDTKATGTPAKWFAREAHIVMVDIDQAELDKMAQVGVRVQGVCADAREFMEQGCPITTFGPPPNPWEQMLPLPSWTQWRTRCQDWKKRYPAVLPEYEQETGVNPYVLIRELSRLAEPGDIIVCDTGCAIAWTCTAWEFKEGQRLLHPWNQTPMGYALPGAIGAHYATGKRVICIVGDGSIQMSIAELTTIAGHNLPIKIVLLNNAGHQMCAQTEREWLDGKNCATTPASGLSFPASFVDVAKGNGIEAERFCDAESVFNCFISDQPYLLEVQLSPHHDVKPKVKFGKPNEDGYPYLPRDEFNEQMIVPMVE